MLHGIFSFLLEKVPKVHSMWWELRDRDGQTKVQKSSASVPHVNKWNQGYGVREIWNAGVTFPNTRRCKTQVQIKVAES